MLNRRDSAHRVERRLIGKEGGKEGAVKQSAVFGYEKC